MDALRERDYLVTYNILKFGLAEWIFSSDLRYDSIGSDVASAEYHGEVGRANEACEPV